MPQVRERLEVGLATPASNYVDALRAAGRLRARLHALFQQIDVLALPSRDQVAPLMTEGGRILEPLSRRNYTAPLNLVRLPAIMISCGFDAQGLPIGLQIAGRAWEEGLLFRLAHAYQLGTDWHVPRQRDFHVSPRERHGASHGSILATVAGRSTALLQAS